MPDYTFDKLISLSQFADENGYYCISLGDGYLAKPRWDPVVLHSAIAMVTQKTKLATATLNINYRHPLEFARNWAVLDQISKGRSILGIGLGTAAAGTRGESDRAFTLESEMQLAGNGDLYERRGTMLQEWIELVKRLWTESRVSFHGTCYNFDDIEIQPKPYQKPRPPIWMSAGYGTLKEFVAVRLAKVSDGWLVNGGTSPELYSEAWEKLKEKLREQGRDPNEYQRAYQLTGALNEDVEAGRHEMILWIKSYYGTDDSSNLDWWGPQGGAGKWIDYLSKCADAGIKTFIVRFAAKDLLEAMQTFSRQVMPSF
jgi:alkanesulfonate monooxygenase SsuD/methylene tetrahydromethanopterin reductase-like flavin-dependent oxidoreductase (luciferase family)